MENQEPLGFISYVPTGAKVLIVDMQQVFIENAEVDTGVKGQLLKRVYDMKDTLLDLKKKGHHIYATVDWEYDNGEIHPVLEGVIDTYLPTWASEMFVPNYRSCNPIHQFELHPEIIKTFGPEDEVIVCGLWRETALSVVTKLLNYEGIVARLSVDPTLSIEMVTINQTSMARSNF